MKIQIIGLAGKMGAGKDSIAKILTENKIVDYKAAFADGVRKITYEVFGIPPEERSPRARDARQFVGNTMRQYDEKVWIKYLAKHLLSLRWNYMPPVVVITDVRYKNEAEWILLNEGIVVYIEAGSDIRKNRIEKRDGLKIPWKKWNEWAEHPSEKELDKIYEMSTVAIYNGDVKMDDLESDFLKWYNSVNKK